MALRHGIGTVEITPRREQCMRWRERSFVVAMLWLLCSSPVGAHPCLCNGDANLDGNFDDADFFFTIGCLGQLPIDVCVNAGINCDGVIDTRDVDPENPFSGDTAIVCLHEGAPPEECCPNHVPCGAESAGPCDRANGTPACRDLTCCIAVCSADPFCCDFMWDSFCADTAKQDCRLPGYCDGDTDIDLQDFALFHNCHTGPGNGPVAEPCLCSDFDGDGDSDRADFRAFQLAYTIPE